MSSINEETGPLESHKRGHVYIRNRDRSSAPALPLTVVAAAGLGWAPAWRAGQRRPSKGPASGPPASSWLPRQSRLQVQARICFKARNLRVPVARRSSVRNTLMVIAMSCKLFRDEMVGERPVRGESHPLRRKQQRRAVPTPPGSCAGLLVAMRLPVVTHYKM